MWKNTIFMTVHLILIAFVKNEWIPMLHTPATSSCYNLTPIVVEGQKGDIIGLVISSQQNNEGFLCQIVNEDGERRVMNFTVQQGQKDEIYRLEHTLVSNQHIQITIFQNKNVDLQNSIGYHLTININSVLYKTQYGIIFPFSPPQNAQSVIQINIQEGKDGSQFCSFKVMLEEVIEGKVWMKAYLPHQGSIRSIEYIQSQKIGQQVSLLFDQICIVSSGNSEQESGIGNWYVFIGKNPQNKSDAGTILENYKLSILTDSDKKCPSFCENKIYTTIPYPASTDTCLCHSKAFYYDTSQKLCLVNCSQIHQKFLAQNNQASESQTGQFTQDYSICQCSEGFTWDRSSSMCEKMNEEEQNILILGYTLGIAGACIFFFFIVLSGVMTYRTRMNNTIWNIEDQSHSEPDNTEQNEPKIQNIA